MKRIKRSEFNELRREVLDIKTDLMELLHPPEFRVGDKIIDDSARVGTIVSAVFTYEPAYEYSGDRFGEHWEWEYKALFDGSMEVEEAYPGRIKLV